VGKLRTHEDKKVADLAKETVRKWKNDVAGHKKPETGTSSTTSTTAAASGKAVSPVAPAKVSSAPASTSTTTANGAVKAENGSSNVAVSERKDRNSKKDGIPNVITEDKARDGSIHLLYNAIVLDSDHGTLKTYFISNL
jgi:transcription elongation factor S-II